MPKWQLVPPESARTHPLFGFGGWLAFFSIGLLVGEGYFLYVAATGWAGFDPLGPVLPWAVGGWHAVLIAEVVLTGLLVLAWFGKARRYRAIWLTLTILISVILPAFTIAVGAALGEVNPEGGRAFMDAAAPGIGAGLAQTLFGGAIFLAYMIRSRRFRVTFENKLRFDDPLLAQRPPSYSSGPSPFFQRPAQPPFG